MPPENGRLFSSMLAMHFSYFVMFYKSPRLINMMKQLISFVLPLVIGYPGLAQEKEASSLFWKISGNGAQPSYLLGTMHLMCPSDIVMSDQMKQAFKSTEKLYLELDMDDPRMMVEAMAGMKMSGDESLDSLLGKEEFDSVSAVFQKLTGFPLTFMKKAQPMMLMSLVYPSLLNCPPQGWETKLMAMAKEENKEILGLEKVAEQLAVFNQIPYEVQARMFVSTLMNIDSTKEEFQKMVATYKSKDLAALHKMATEDADFSKYEESMLVNRNRNWIPVIKNAVKENSVFIAVGAAHLPGQTGVIALLREQGFTVVPLHD